VNEGEPGVLPEWVVQKPDASTAGESREPWVAETLAHLECVLLPGTQENTLTRLAWWAAGNLPMDIARVVLTKGTGRTDGGLIGVDPTAAGIVPRVTTNARLSLSTPGASMSVGARAAV
jgi:hypothetical protein